MKTVYRSLAVATSLAALYNVYHKLAIGYEASYMVAPIVLMTISLMVTTLVIKITKG